jgi:hypothetical protein
MINLNIDLAGLLDIEKELGPRARKLLAEAAEDLATQTHTHIIEEAQAHLHSTREKYTNALGFRQVDESTWEINLDADAMWIEEGMGEHDMLPDLLKSPKAKTAADGCVLNPRNKVLTSLGWKKIKDIAPGDMVLTHSGKFREVKQLLVTKGGVGTEYISFYPVSMDRSGKNGKGPSKANSDLIAPSISLTLDHPVLTPKGWVPAGSLVKGSLVATPADLNRLCKNCNAPLPINAPFVEYCMNHHCAPSHGVKTGRMLKLTKEERTLNSKMGNKKAREMGVFERKDWGARNPEVLKRMRDGSVKACRDKSITGKWGSEVFFEKQLLDLGLTNSDFLREFPIKTDRWVNAGGGRQRQSTLFIDFYFPKLKLAIELDGTHWHSLPDALERDAAKDRACKRDDIRLLRIPSHKIYKRGPKLARYIKLWLKNHSGELGLAWVKIEKVKKGTVNRPDHIFAKKYDICLDADEHSFCCETVFIHNSRYLVVPFDHKKGPTKSTPAQQDLTNTIKAELKRRNIPYGSLEKDAKGNVKTGTLHSFNIMSRPTKSHDGPGQGHGPIGAVRQGNTGIPFLQGVRVIQKQIAGTQKFAKNIMTFRVASSKHKGSGKWQHPGLVPRKFFDKAAEWAIEQFLTHIAPRILSSL